MNVADLDALSVAYRDKRLSWTARGLSLYLLGLGHDEYPTAAELAAMSPNEGPEEIQKALDELRDLGYIEIPDQGVSS